MGSPPLKFPNGEDRIGGYIRGVPERSFRIGSFLSDEDVLQGRGSRIWLDLGFSAPAFREIQLHGCLKYKSLRGYIRILQYFYHSGDLSQTFFNWTQTPLDFLFSSDLAVEGMWEVIHIECL